MLNSIVSISCRLKQILDTNLLLNTFLPGLDAYKEYLTKCATKPDFSESDSFAPDLFTHLLDEIPTLFSLSKFGDKLPLLDMVNSESPKSPLHQSITGGTPFLFRNLDVEFEDGLWKDWPEMPAPIWWILQKTFVAWNAGGGLLAVMQTRNYESYRN